MSEDSGIQVPPEDNCEALFGTHISANIMLALLRKLDPKVAADKHHMGTNTAPLPASYKLWSTLTVFNSLSINISSYYYIFDLI
jgi:hypothetical protein